MMVGPRRARIATAIIATTALLGACADSRASVRATTASTAVASSAAASLPATATLAPATAGSAAATRTVPKSSPTAARVDGVPRFDHIVVVVEENKPYGKLVGTPDTPFLTSLAAHGAVLTRSYAVTHPSEPNYLALFSGSTHGLTSDSCPHQFTGPNLATALIAARHTFTGYSESLPSVGYQGCSSGNYARKHSPWVNFALPKAVNQPFTAFPTDLTRLPDVSFVIPNLQDDMHDGSIAKGDQWLESHLSAYRTWATTHNSLLVVTTDEDDKSDGNHITTILAGAHVKTGRYSARTDHYGVLHTLLDSFGITPFAAAATSPAVTGDWTG
jgi:phosphatidylinositol-3-phosphatase